MINLTFKFHVIFEIDHIINETVNHLQINVEVLSQILSNLQHRILFYCIITILSLILFFSFSYVYMQCYTGIGNKSWCKV